MSVWNKALGAAVGGMFVLSPAVGGAAKSWHGDDYSYDAYGRASMSSCDRESDSHKVHGDFQTQDGYQALVRDSNGANGDCAHMNVYALGHGLVTRHRTCEEKPFWPDDCWGWVNAG